jgi:hypothetical protein
MKQTWMGVALLALSGAGLTAADEDQVKWLKLDEARAKSIVTGKPVLVICISDLIPDGPATKGLDRSFTSELVRPQKDEFLFVKCTDMATIKAVQATSKCEFITFDPDGDVILRTVVKSTQDLANAMKTSLTTYANQPIVWSSDPPMPVERGATGKVLTVLLFKDASDEVATTIHSLEDRSVVKFHSRCNFVAMEFRKGSSEVARWNVLSAPTLILLDPQKEFGPKSILERAAEKKTPRELRAFFRKGLVTLEKARR